MTDALHRQRCFNHHAREAAARCPECGQFYCRECVTEHEGRVLCMPCLEALAIATDRAGARRIVPSLAVQAVAGFLLLWFLFTLLGEGLAVVPDSFHEGNPAVQE